MNNTVFKKVKLIYDFYQNDMPYIYNGLIPNIIYSWVF